MQKIFDEKEIEGREREKKKETAALSLSLVFYFRRRGATFFDVKEREREIPSLCVPSPSLFLRSLPCGSLLHSLEGRRLG